MRRSSSLEYPVSSSQLWLRATICSRSSNRSTGSGEWRSEDLNRSSLLRKLSSACFRAVMSRTIGRADDTVCGISYWRNGDRHINGPPILGDSYRLIVLDGLATSEATKNHILLRLPIGRNQASDRLPN